MANQKTQIMKKLVLTLVATCLSLSGFSQSLFDKFENMDQVSAVIVNKGMINLLTSIGEGTGDPEAEEFISLAKELDGLKVFVTEDKDVSSQMRASVDAYLESSSLEELIRVKDKDTHVKFYIRSGKDENHVKELLMFVTGLDKIQAGPEGRKIESVILTMKGDIDLRKIGSLTRNMDLPSELNKAGKKGQ